jgi:ubiquinone/menaquinone biosynthesis C-methylase UbiE
MSGAEEDVPYGENFHDEGEAAAWADAAMRKRPWRSTIFERFAATVLESETDRPRVLELGSGPGFLAEHVLDHCPSIAEYTLVDFSQAMLGQSRRRLSQHAARTNFVQADFKNESWTAAVRGPFDLVFSLQAVHELRHKRHAPRLYEQIRSVASSRSEFVVCDHLPEAVHTPRHVVLYMTVTENLAALAKAGFNDAMLIWSDHAMAMYRARC